MQLRGSEGTPKLFVSESDLDAALKVLADNPLSPFSAEPEPWRRQRLMGLIRESLPKHAEYGSVFRVASRVWAIVQPRGVEFVDQVDSQDLQLWLLVRPCHTGPDHMIELGA